MVDWIIGVASNPDRFPRDSEDQMERFGLTQNQRDVLRSGDSSLIRKWVLYELACFVYGGTMHYAVAVTHGIPPPPPPPRPPEDEGAEG
jgi:hypothetical protein